MYANAACVIENMAIAATSLGIANIVWAGPAAVLSENKDISKMVSIPDGFKPVLCASFGYVAESSKPKCHEIIVNRV